jgi:hypothetical protein
MGHVLHFYIDLTRKTIWKGGRGEIKGAITDLLPRLGDFLCKKKVYIHRLVMGVAVMQRPSPGAQPQSIKNKDQCQRHSAASLYQTFMIPMSSRMYNNDTRNKAIGKDRFCCHQY